MPARIALFLIALLALRGAFAQAESDTGAQSNANLQNLLAALANGTEVVLYTPLADGMLQITRFQPPIRVPRPQGEAAVAIARQHLRLLDIPSPTAEQFAKALVGGMIDTPDGPVQLPAVLPTTGVPAVVMSQLVLPNGLPEVSPPVAAAASGATSAPQPLPSIPTP